MAKGPDAGLAPDNIWEIRPSEQPTAPAKSRLVGYFARLSSKKRAKGAFIGLLPNQTLTTLKLMTQLSTPVLQFGYMDGNPPTGHAFSMAKRRKTFIKEWREYRKLTQEQLAEAIGKSPATISHLENGNVNYTQDNLEAIAEVLLCEPEDLLSRAPDGPVDIRDYMAKADPDLRKAILRAVKGLCAPED